MFIQSFASSSSGNCALIGSGKTYILLDAGVSLRRIRDCLCKIGLGLSDISALLLTHEHSDHIAAVGMLEKNTDIPVYASCGTMNALMTKSKACGRGFCAVSAGEEFQIGDICVNAAATSHDAAESLCYGFTDGKSRVAAVTDLGYLSENVASAVMGADTVMLEANHDVEMLKNGPYPYPLRKRILGDCGHLSNAAAGDFALELAKNGVKNILLAHLSRENNTPHVAYKTVADRMLAGGIEPGSLKMTVAPADDMSGIIE
jgi:phosphoribosyl 1,2-cyclic phosphodiesterase